MLLACSCLLGLCLLVHNLRKGLSACVALNKYFTWMMECGVLVSKYYQPNVINHLIYLAICIVNSHELDCLEHLMFLFCF